MHAVRRHTDHPDGEGRPPAPGEPRHPPAFRGPRRSSGSARPFPGSAGSPPCRASRRAAPDSAADEIDRPVDQCAAARANGRRVAGSPGVRLQTGHLGPSRWASASTRSTSGRTSSARPVPAIPTGCGGWRAGCSGRSPDSDPTRGGVQHPADQLSRGKAPRVSRPAWRTEEPRCLSAAVAASSRPVTAWGRRRPERPASGRCPPGFARTGRRPDHPEQVDGRPQVRRGMRWVRVMPRVVQAGTAPSPSAIIRACRLPSG